MDALLDRKALQDDGTVAAAQERLVAPLKKQKARKLTAYRLYPEMI